VALANSLDREPGAGKSSFFSQRFFRVSRTARGEAATGAKKRRGASAVKTDREDQ